MKFVQFLEYNDSEGETWAFWLQLDGNEVELGKLKERINSVSAVSELFYSLDMEPIDESEVDIVVKHARGSYMDSDHKVVGTFTMPDEDNFNEEEGDAWFDDNFYKGGIQSSFDVTK